jgi:hypothetical protein
MEEWRAVIGYENIYEVSDRGRVRRTNTEQIRKPRNHKGGYLYVDLGKGRRYAHGHYLRGYFTRFYIHRLVACMFIGPIPYKYEINHRDGNKKNNSLQNLEVVTSSENHKHAARHGLAARGELNGMAKLNDEAVREILLRYANGGGTYQQLAIDYGVCSATIGQIIRREHWVHVY